MSDTVNYTSVYEFFQTTIKNVFGSDGFIAPDIPEKKINGAIKSITQNQCRPNDILALDDSTVFGSATDGIVFTIDKMYIHNKCQIKHMEILFSDIKSAEYVVKKSTDKDGKEKIDEEYCLLEINGHEPLKLHEYKKDEKLTEFFLALRDLAPIAVKTAKVERQPLEDMPIQIRLTYLKVIINFLMSYGEIDDNSYSKLYNLIIRLKVDQDGRRQLLDYRSEPEPTDELLNFLLENIDEVMHRELKYSLIKDMIYIHEESKGGSYRESGFIQEIITKLGVSEEQLNVIEKAIESDRKLFDDSVDDSGLESGIKELSAGAAAVGVPMAALYFSGAVTGLGATGITSGLASLGFGGILGFSSMATGLGTLLLLGYGAKKGMDALTGKGELDKRKRKEAMLLDVNKSMQRSINCMMTDLNMTIQELSDAIVANNELDARIGELQVKATEKINFLMARIRQMSGAGRVISKDAAYSEACAIRQRVPYHLDQEKIALLTTDPTRQQFKSVIENMYEDEEGKMILKKDLTLEQVEVLAGLLQRIEYFSLGGSLNTGLNKVKGMFGKKEHDQ